MTWSLNRWGSRHDRKKKTLLKIARCTSKHSSSCSKLSSKPWVILYHPNCSYRENFGITITWCGQVPLTPMLTSKFRYYNNLMVFVPSLRLKKKKELHIGPKKKGQISDILLLFQMTHEFKKDALQWRWLLGMDKGMPAARLGQRRARQEWTTSSPAKN